MVPREQEVAAGSSLSVLVQEEQVSAPGPVQWWRWYCQELARQGTGSKRMYRTPFQGWRRRMDQEVEYSVGPQ